LWKSLGRAKVDAACGKVNRTSTAPPSEGLTYLPNCNTFNSLCHKRIPYLWSNHGEAHLPSSEQAPSEDARLSCAHGDEVGTSRSEPAPEEGAQAAHRQTAFEVRRRLSFWVSLAAIG
jgi:hypothetical protein